MENRMIQNSMHLPFKSSVTYLPCLSSDQLNGTILSEVNAKFYGEITIRNYITYLIDPNKNKKTKNIYQ